MIDDFSENESEYLSDESETFHEIMKIYQKEVKHKKQARSTKLPASVANLMGEANQYFMFDKLDDAIKIAYEIIRIYPDYPEPYHLLGVIYEEQSQKKKAANFYTLAAQLTQSDSKLWEKIGNLYKEAGSFEQASYSFGRALKSDSNNKMLMLDRAECFESLGDFKKAIKVIEKIISSTSNNAIVIKKCAKLYSKIGQVHKSIELFRSLLRDFQTQAIDYNILNMICELYIKDSKYDVMVEFLEEFLEITTPEDFSVLQKKLEDVPLDIVTKYGIGKVKLNKPKEAEAAFELLLKDDIHEYADLFQKVMECFEELGNPGKALSICQQLMLLPEHNNSDLWLRKGILARKVNDNETAIDAFMNAIAQSEDNVEAKVNLSNIYMNEGKVYDALNVLNLKKEFPNLVLGDENEMENAEEDEDVFLSDDDGPPKPVTVPNRNDVGLYQTISSKKHDDRSAYEPKLQKKVKFSEDEAIPVPFKLTEEQILKDQSANPVEKIENRLTELKSKYHIDEIILKFKQAEILLGRQENEELIELILEPLKAALELEVELQNLKRKVLSKYLFQSQKKNFKKRMEFGIEINDEDDSRLLFKSKKAKIPTQLLQKRKTKYSTFLTERHFDKVQSMTKAYDKIEFYKLVEKIVQVFEQNKRYQDISDISELLILLRPQFVDKCNLSMDVYILGFISNYQLKNYEKAFYYLKACSKYFSENNFFYTVLAIALQKIEDPAVYRIYMSKLQVSDMIFKSDIKVQILGNNYLQTGFYDLCIRTYYHLYSKQPENPLYNMLLGIAFLQNSTSRTTLNKTQSLKRAFYFFNQYFENRKNTHICESLYNLGRMYAQLSYFKEAIKCFDSVLTHHLKRSLILSRALKTEDTKEEYCCENDNYLNQSVYNLIIIHKKLGNTDIVKQLIADYFAVKSC